MTPPHTHTHVYDIPSSSFTVLFSSAFGKGKDLNGFKFCFFCFSNLRRVYPYSDKQKSTTLRAPGS